MKTVFTIQTNQGAVSLRSPIPSDALIIADYWFGPQSEHLKSSVNFSIFGSRDEFLSRMTASFSNISDNGPYPTLIAVRDELPIATVLINSIKEPIEALVHVHIWDPINRRNGIASSLANEAFSYFFRSFDVQRLVMQVPSKNLPVLKLLESLGFTSEGTRFGKASPLSIEDNFERFVITADIFKRK